MMGTGAFFGRWIMLEYFHFVENPFEQKIPKSEGPLYAAQGVLSP
jgi:hypothetical protein